MRGTEIRLDDLTFVRPGSGGERTILDKINACFQPGELTVVRGATGAGKSTLLHIVAGLYRPTSGTVFAGDEPVSRFTSYHRDFWRRKVGIALQTPSLLGDLTVKQNVVLPLIPRRLGPKEIERLGDRAMELLALPSFAGKPVVELSSGERERVVMARALASEPGIVIADEPTAYQDEKGVSIILDALLQAKKNGATILVASHDRRFIEGNGVDTQYSLNDGVLGQVK